MNNYLDWEKAGTLIAMYEVKTRNKKAINIIIMGGTMYTFIRTQQVSTFPLPIGSELMNKWKLLKNIWKRIQPMFSLPSRKTSSFYYKEEQDRFEESIQQLRTSYPITIF